MPYLDQLDYKGTLYDLQDSNLKKELEDITEPIYSSNIFDQENTTITEGKYLNYTNGNEGTNASYCSFT